MNLIRHGISRITQTERHSRQRQLRLATIVVAVLAMLATFAAPANAKPVAPKNGHGVIEMTVRTCGNASTWQAQAAANGITASSGYLVLRGRTYDIDCTRRAGAAVTVRPAQQQASRAAVRSSSWVHPLASGVRASGPGACPGAARSGHTHKGIDLSARSGTAIRSVGGGQVTVSRYSGSAGWYVVVNHGRYTSTYMHLRVQGARVGTNVAPGSVIGQVGATGNAQGPHLHFEATGAGNTARTARAFGLNLGC